MIIPRTTPIRWIEQVMRWVAPILIVLALCGCREEQDRRAAMEACTTEAIKIYQRNMFGRANRQRTSQHACVLPVIS